MQEIVSIIQISLKGKTKIKKLLPEYTKIQCIKIKNLNFRTLKLKLERKWTERNTLKQT